MNILCLFAGQGSQQHDLFHIFDHHQEAQEIIAEISTISSMDLHQPDVPITSPDYSQLIIAYYQLTLFRILEPLLQSHSIDCAGYSLGEVSAFLASTQASWNMAQQVLSYRTQLMTSLLQQRPLTQYDLVHLSGSFEYEFIDTLCSKHDCFIAIVNPKNHFVIGGSINALDTLRTAIPQQQITQYTFLKIHVPSHTPLYQTNQGLFHKMLSSLDCGRLRYPIFSPITCGKTYTLNEQQRLLDQELYTPLQWDKICALIAEYQYDVIIDIGPEASMTHFLRLLNNDLPIITLSDYKSINGILRAVSSKLAD